MPTKNEFKPELVNFEPGVYIELADTFTETRKIARVANNGTAYYDLDAPDATAFPIYETLNPVEVGNILGWGLHLADQRPNEHAAFKALVDKLIGAGTDVLTYTRAAHWAFVHHSYDFAMALEAGKKATEIVQRGRSNMDKIIAVAEGVK